MKILRRLEVSVYGTLVVLGCCNIPEGAWARPITICPTCSDTLMLTKQQWQCLGQDLDLYVGSAADPVFVSLYGCGSTEPTKDPVRDSGIDIRITGGKNDQAEQYAKAIRLSQDQVSCLNSLIASLVTEAPVQFDFRKRCPEIP